MNGRLSIKRLAAILTVPGALVIGYLVWSPGSDVRDGRHDSGRNAIWLQHGWLGDDDWFVRNQRTNRLYYFRDANSVRRLAARLKQHRISDVYPHLCPALVSGRVPAVDAVQTERFLDEFAGFRVLPWIGGVRGVSARPESHAWRGEFVRSVVELLRAHPRLSGVQVNIEPMPSGDADFLALLDELKAALPPGKLLSVAAYPPPTRWHVFPEVHWDEAYFRRVAPRVDQLAVMMYDTALTNGKIYQHLMAGWTREVIAWSEPTQVLLGLPAYDDADSGYHHPTVENLGNGLRGIHRGLAGWSKLPANYQGVAIYSEWEMDDAEWRLLRDLFLKNDPR